MKKQLYIIGMAALLAACSAEDDTRAVGYLSLTDLTVTCEGEALPLSKAVDAGLQVQVCQGETVVRDYAPGTDLSRRVALPVGSYTVKAFTPDQAEAADNVAGHPVYSIVSDAFAITDGDLTTLSLVAPQVNVGVKAVFDANTLADFPTASLTLTAATGRTVTIGAGNADTYYYFNLPADGRIDYTIRVTNADGEAFSRDGALTSVEAKNYAVAVRLD